MIFLTGGTGFLGTALLSNFLESLPDTPIAVLVRASSDEEATARLRESCKQLVDKMGVTNFDNRVIAMRGDLTAQGLGLSKRNQERLHSEATSFYHNAANTNLGLPMESHYPVNVGGTKQALEFAQRIQKPSSDFTFYYISTAFVAGDKKGIVQASDLSNPLRFRNAYEQSKSIAESHVKNYNNVFRTVTYRPSIIVGDSNTGVTSTFNVIYIPARIILSGLLKVIPGIPHIPFDMVPVDYVAKSITAAHGMNVPSGSAFYLSSGLGRESSPGEIMDLLFHAAQMFHGKSVARRPNFICQDVALKTYNSVSSLATNVYHSAVFKHFEQIVSEKVPVFRQILPLIPYMISNPQFDNKPTLTAFSGRIEPAPQFSQYAERIFRYCLQSDWGKISHLPSLRAV